jgi:LytS/YehU family sensor histidine kinase
VLNPKLPVKVLWKNIHKFGVLSDSAKIKCNLNLEHLNNYFSSSPILMDFNSKLETIQNIEDGNKVFDFPQFKIKPVTLSAIKQAFFSY